MAGHNEVLNFVNKFVNLWKTGFEAKLHVEAQAGQAWVRLHVGLGHYQPQHGRKPGPSQLRRRARRAEARASQAAAQAADLPPAHNTDEAVEASAPVPLTLAAAQAAVLVPGNMAAEEVADVAMKVVVNVPYSDAAAQVALPVPPIPAAQATHPSHENIPQLDGTDAISSIQCDNCHKSFETRDQLTTHDEIHQFGCDE